MNPNELRIGNLLTNYGNLCKVFAIQEDNFQVEVIKVEHIVEIDFNNPKFISSLIMPISLTEEWLTILGFIKTKPNSIFDYPYWSMDGVEILFQADQTFLFNASCGNIPIHFVHQIQNLYFVLTGKELEIKN